MGTVQSTGNQEPEWDCTDEKEMERAKGFETGTILSPISVKTGVNKHLFACLSQFERRLIQEGSRPGLEAARARG